MTNPTPLTDSTALTRFRSRVHSDDLFLHQAVADEVEDRLKMVNRPFKAPLIVSGFSSFWKTVADQAVHLPDTDTLAITRNDHDLSLHMMSLHWANDPIGQIIQCKRAMCADGFFLSASFGGQTLHELRSCLGQAEIEVSGGLSPRVAPMGELRDMGALLQRAGLTLPVADSMTLDVQYRDLWHLMHDLRAMGETNALTSRRRNPTRRAVFERADALYQTNFPGETGGINATFEIIFLTGWVPDESQPKPLRPGSASARLADALGTDETSLPD